MKTTIDLPDELLRQAKATAALRGESLKELVTVALRAQLERHGATPPGPPGWRSVFGRARREEVEEIDRIVTADLERVDPEEWR